MGTAAVLSMNMHAGPAPGWLDSVTGKQWFKFGGGGGTLSTAIILNCCDAGFPSKAKANAPKIGEVWCLGTLFFLCCFRECQTKGTETPFFT